MMTRFPSFIKEDNPEGSGDSKQVAQQQVETQRQVLAQREIEAKQKVATAPMSSMRTRSPTSRPSNPHISFPSTGRWNKRTQVAFSEAPVTMPPP